MSIKVKICGISTLADARFLAAAGADMLGFIQYSKSPRYISTRSAKEIIEWIHGPQSVGVFVNEKAQIVNASAEAADFDFVQLHGNESPGYCAQMTRPVIKAISVKADAVPQRLRRQLSSYSSVVQYFLLDTHHPVLKGGTGVPFNWDIAAQLTRDFPILLAGGIGPENVQSAISATNPLGVDSSSRLEYKPGHKDLDKINDFFQRISQIQS